MQCMYKYFVLIANIQTLFVQTNYEIGQHTMAVLVLKAINDDSKRSRDVQLVD